MNTSELARASFLRACTLDVEVRKPGNVSRSSPGHGMTAATFLESARVAARPLCTPGARVGERIEGAVDATWAAAGCNTNLGIVLLCAPIARACEHVPRADAAALHEALVAVLGDLDLADAQAAYRAIVRADPAGLGTVEHEDVRRAPGVDLREAMTLAADRDSIARQYRDGYADLFEIGLPALRRECSPLGRTLGPRVDRACAGAVQRLYLTMLARFADSHIVRKHGAAVAQTVMTAAQRWLARAEGLARCDDYPAFAAWDEALKAGGINPGTSADLTVATLMIAGLVESPA
jgi:triphosphoribosyl-dephospho-CoA synthase